MFSLCLICGHIQNSQPGLILLDKIRPEANAAYGAWSIGVRDFKSRDFPKIYSLITEHLLFIVTDHSADQSTQQTQDKDMNPTPDPPYFNITNAASWLLLVVLVNSK